jgi:hypothetical protein
VDLFRHNTTMVLYAVKFVPRGESMTAQVEREVRNPTKMNARHYTCIDGSFQGSRDGCDPKLATRRQRRAPAVPTDAPSASSLRLDLAIHPPLSGQRDR